MQAVHDTLGNATLLDTYFARLDQICTLIETQSHNNINTELARDIIGRKRLNVLMYGRSGAGKTTLVGCLTNRQELKAVGELGEGGVTLEVTNYRCESGLHFTDRPGIDVPGAQAQTAEGKATLEQMSGAASIIKSLSDFLAEQARRTEWNRQLSDLDRRLRSSSAEDRPLALAYVQHAAARLYPEKVMELVRRPHDLLVPTFIIISDKWAVSKQELATKEAEVAELIRQVGPNKRGKTVIQISLSSKPKDVGGTRHPEAGVPDFVSTLLSTLDPADALTFIRYDGLLGRVMGRKRSRHEAQ